jgi:hypothetical protein
MIQACLGEGAETWDAISKTKQKRTEGVAQAVENLPSKHQALSSNPSTDEKKRKVKVVPLGSPAAEIAGGSLHPRLFPPAG